MGVPGLMRWLQQQFPSACQHLSRLDSNYLRKTHSLCIDLNGTLHQNARQTNGDVTPVLEAIETIVRAVKPQHTLFLAIDGVPPRIKERLQRGRRKQCATHSNKQGDKEKFHAYAITPGTQWMWQVERHLTEFIEAKRRNDMEWKQLRVVLSGYRDPGEGEQKIMDYLCEVQETEHGGVHYVLSNDADTVLLSLGTHVRSIVLINERYMGVGLSSYIVTDIDRLTASLVDRYKPAGECSRDQVVDDLVFMSFFAGNDFLPPISMVSGAVDGRGIDALWTLYSKLPERCRGLHNGGEINYSALTRFLEKIEETHEKREFQKHIGVTMLGPQLTAMRIRRMGWEQQRKQAEGVFARSTASSRRLPSKGGRCTKVSCSCCCHRGKQRNGNQVPFVWTGPLSQINFSNNQMLEDGDVATLDGSRILGSDETPKWHPVTEDMECPFLTLNKMPLLCPALLQVFRIMVSLASGERMLKNGDRIMVETCRRIDSNRVKWLQTAGIMLRQEIKFYDYSTRSKEFEAMSSSWTQQHGPETATPEGSLSSPVAAAVLVAHAWPGSDEPSSIVSIRPASAAIREYMGEAKNMLVALVGSDAWGVLHDDGRTEHKRAHERVKWKDAFYRQSYSGSNHDGSAMATKLSACYADALAWTSLYYFARRVSSWQFTWPEDIESALCWVAPLASDLSTHLKKQLADGRNGCANVRWDLAPDSEGRPPLLREHLVSVMPREAWTSTLTDNERELAKHLAKCKFSEEARQWVHGQLLATSSELPVVKVWL
ncbi:exonuclease II Exo2 [Coemansia sp. RSA 1843]|nr:exonuclease II Exo2 [Coemansia sp. RSA 1843]